MNPSPYTDYDSLQFARYERRRLQLRKRNTVFSWLRAALFVAAVFVLPLEIAAWVKVGGIVALLGGFFVLLRAQILIERAINRIDILITWRRRQQARAALDWQSIPPERSFAAESRSPSEIDLDLIGPASLHRLMDISVSASGSALLRSWLDSSEPSPDAVLARQKTVQTLAPMERFRTRMHLALAEVSTDQLEGDELLSWLRNASAPAVLRWLLPVSFALCGVTLVLFVLNGLEFIPPWWIASLAVYLIIYLLSGAVREGFLSTAADLDAELQKLKALLYFLERYPLAKDSLLAALCAPLRGAERPSRLIRAIARYAAAAGFSMNPILRFILNGAFPWDFYFAAKLERIRLVLLSRLPEWLHVIHKLDALQSLANFAYLNNRYAFPSLYVCEPGKPLFAASDLAHPLIVNEGRIGNDFTMNEMGTAVLITGSNMSGKSTFLRAVGMNIRLALAGGPVCATAMSLAFVRLETCIRIQDSLNEGLSYFYAEVKRLRAILDELEKDSPYPLLFLIDEIYKGTNNIERNTGSGAYLRAVVGKRGAGMVTTHDIELTHIAEKLPALVNHHFREEIRNGTMAFDYRIHPGPCPTTNALRIMEMEGLPVK